MTSKERAVLKAQAMKIDSIFQIGKSSLSPAQVEAIRSALQTRELIKISVLKNCGDDPAELAEVIAQRTGSQVVQVIGKKIVLYKKNAKREAGKPERKRNGLRDRKKSAKASGKEFAKVSGRDSARATGKGTAKVSGKDSARTTGRDSARVSGKDSPRATGKGSAKATGKKFYRSGERNGTRSGGAGQGRAKAIQRGQKGRTARHG